MTIKQSSLETIMKIQNAIDSYYDNSKSLDDVINSIYDYSLDMDLNYCIYKLGLDDYLLCALDWLKAKDLNAVGYAFDDIYLAILTV